MTISDRITQARRDRTARLALRVERRELARELAAYSTPADRMEIELLAGRNPGPDTEMVLNLLNAVSYNDRSYNNDVFYNGGRTSQRSAA